MNETIQPNSVSAPPLPNSDLRKREPDPSMQPGSRLEPPAAVGMVKHAAQGAHETIDRLADSAAPAVRQLGNSVAAAGEALHAKTDQLRDTGNAWVEDVRTTVRNKPLLSVAAAFALGALIARFTRISR